MEHKLVITKSAEKFINKLNDKKMANKIRTSLIVLAADPYGYQGDAKKLKGEFEGLYRLRAGSYRVHYAVIDEELVVLVVEMSHRKDSYRGVIMKTGKMVLDNRTYVILPEEHLKPYLEWLGDSRAKEEYEKVLRGEVETVDMVESMAQRGNNIASLRKAKGLNQTQLAQALGTTQGHLSRWENGENSPSPKYITKLMQELECGIEDIFNLDN